MKLTEPLLNHVIGLYRIHDFIDNLVIDTSRFGDLDINMIDPSPNFEGPQTREGFYFVLDRGLPRYVITPWGTCMLFDVKNKEFEPIGEMEDYLKQLFNVTKIDEELAEVYGYGSIGPVYRVGAISGLVVDTTAYFKPGPLFVQTNKLRWDIAKSAYRRFVHGLPTKGG